MKQITKSFNPTILLGKANFSECNIYEDFLKELQKTKPGSSFNYLLHNKDITGFGDSLYSSLYETGHIRLIVDEGPEGERLEYEIITVMAMEFIRNFFIANRM